MAWSPEFDRLRSTYQRNTSAPSLTLDQSLLERPDAKAAMAAGPEALYAWKMQNNVHSPGGQHVDRSTGKIVKDRDVFWTHGLPILGGILTAGLAGPAIAGALGGAGSAGGAAGGVAGATGAGAGTAGGFLGSLGGIKGILGSVGPIAGAIAGGRGQGRMAEEDMNLARGRAESERALSNSRIDDTRMAQALRLALLGGVQDAQLTPPPEVARFMPQLTGGIKPSAIKDREGIINAMQPRILESLMSGNHVPALPDQPSSNWVDKLLEGTSYGSAFLGSLPKRTPAPTPGVNIASRNPGLVRNSGVRF